MSTARKRASLATAKVIPIFLALLVAYASYVVTGPLAIDYLLNPPDQSVPRRLAAGLAIPIVYFLIIIPVAATWLRLLATVWGDPGYIALGDGAALSDNEPAPGLQEFYQKDVFCCDPRGLPIWCHHCQNWKPDRAHHNQDVGRCTTKMDHFCPWVGGVVGERSYKFFLQFLFYSVILTAFIMSCLAYFVAERARKEIGQNVQWLIALAISAFFCLFTIGMVTNSLWMVFQNVTTIENLNPQSRTLLIAVLLPPEYQQDQPSAPTQGTSSAELQQSSNSDQFGSHEQPNFLRQTSVAKRIWQGTITYPLHLPTDRPPLPAPQLRKFAILETLPGMNIWNLGSAWLNFKSVFGSKPHEWLLPIHHSPCCDHSGVLSQYALGPDFEDLLIEVGLLSSSERSPASEFMNGGEPDGLRGLSREQRRKRKRRLDAGWQNGECPDGWITEKEARRARRQQQNRGQRHDREGIPEPER